MTIGIGTCISENLLLGISIISVAFSVLVEHYSELCDTISPHAVTKHVVSGEWILKVNKKSKGSHGWDQFHLVWDPVKNEQVHGFACCSMCKSSLLYKRMENEEEKSLGTKNMLDHSKNCTPIFLQ